jgi:hypothetical protein
MLLVAFVVLTAIYLGAEIYANRVLGPRRKPSDETAKASPPHPAE